MGAIIQKMEIYGDCQQSPNRISKLAGDRLRNTIYKIAPDILVDFCHNLTIFSDGVCCKRFVKDGKLFCRGSCAVTSGKDGICFGAADKRRFLAKNRYISENYRMKWHQIYFELSLEWYLVDGTVCDLSSITFLQLSDIANANARNFFIHV